MDDSNKLDEAQRIMHDLEELQKERKEIQKKLVETIDELMEEETRLLNSSDWQKWEDLIDKEKELFQKLKGIQS